MNDSPEDQLSEQISTMTERNRVIILGVSGMLGHVLFTELLKDNSLDVYGTVRQKEVFVDRLDAATEKRLICKVDAFQTEALRNVLEQRGPAIVINCIGIIKQLPEAQVPRKAIFINALFPHILSEICKDIGARLIHISTDCVFDGKKGSYVEEDETNAKDLYGRTKALGELREEHCVTLRTSIIGHELSSHIGLIEWFLSRQGTIDGFTRAIFSGLPTIELSSVIRKIIKEQPDISGLFHVSASPISKYDLLCKVASVYGKSIEIRQSSSVTEDKSLDSSRFRSLAGYEPPGWDTLIEKMHSYFVLNKALYSR